jgi:predicted MPP superfamily phosphohydrolase
VTAGFDQDGRIVELLSFWLPLLAGSLGHGALLVFAQNWLFGIPFPRSVLTAIRKINLPLILAGPVLIALLLAELYPVARAFDVSLARGWKVLPASYLGLCWIVGLVVAPVLQLRYWLRPRPPQLTGTHTETVDVGAQLGYKPVGQGEHRALARLPGNQVFQVDFTERVFRLPQLPPEWHGLSILHLSDLHLRGTPDRAYYQWVLERCRDWDCDLLALTGDVVDSAHHHRWVLPVLGRLRWRVAAFAVLGNHDSWYEPERTRRRLRRLGMTVLGNDWAVLEIRGQRLIVLGHEGPWFRPTPDLAECPAEGFRLCLSHTPDNLAWARRHHVDLMLAGHNHGGQIRLPLLGSVFVPCRSGRAYDGGPFFAAPTLLHVSRGLGGQAPVRYGCRPEVTRLVLKGMDEG